MNVLFVVMRVGLYSTMLFSLYVSMLSNCAAQGLNPLRKPQGETAGAPMLTNVPAANGSSPSLTMPAALTDAIAALMEQAPRKQIDPRTGDVNREIGRTPGAACEVIRFFSRVLTLYPQRDDIRGKLIALSNWVVGLQSHDAGTQWFGGVPSMPDLPGVAAHYYYTIDAAFCGNAMFAAYRVTRDHRYRRAAYRFADFLLAMHRGPDRPAAASGVTGFCEFVIAGQPGVWNCDNYVKSMLALPVLAQAARLKPDDSYAKAAAEARAFLVPGLAGAWEYASAASVRSCAVGDCVPQWQRVPGPRKERNWFVYGDTLAYGIRALFEYEGPSDTVRRLYTEFSTYQGKGSSAAYDGRIAFAGYMKPASREPDPESAYYDLVTLGILHPVRRAIAAADFRIADRQLRDRMLVAASRSWKMDFEKRAETEQFIDISTIANLAEAYLTSEAK